MDRDRDFNERDAATAPRPRDFRNALRENEADAALREGRVDDLRREDAIRTYETARPRTAYDETTPRTTTEAGTVGGTYAPAATAVAPTTTTTERRVETVDDRRRPFSFVAGFLGWAVASFFTFVLLAIILGVLGASATSTAGGTVTLNQTLLNDLTWPGIVGGLLAVFVAYFAGGYNAGRIDRDHGMTQGVAVVGWTLLFGILAAVLANTAATAYDVGAYFAPYRIDWGALTTQGIVGLVLTLLVMLAGAILGGITGERWLRRDAAYEERRGYRAYRSRPRV